MAIEVVDVEEEAAPPSPSPEREEKKEKEETAETPPTAASRRGRPPGSKDKQPRKRPARAVSPEVLEKRRRRDR